MLHYFILLLITDCDTEPSETQKGEIYSNWFHPYVVNLNGKALKETHIKFLSLGGLPLTLTIPTNPITLN